jgi:hypothetical protein
MRIRDGGLISGLINSFQVREDIGAIKMENLIYQKRVLHYQAKIGSGRLYGILINIKTLLMKMDGHMLLIFLILFIRNKVCLMLLEEENGSEYVNRKRKISKIRRTHQVQQHQRRNDYKYILILFIKTNGIS